MSQRNGEVLVVLKGYVPISLKIQFKVLCVQEQLTMSSVLENLIKTWIKEGAPIPKSTVNVPYKDLQQIKGYIPKSLKLEFKAICAQKQVKMDFVMFNLIDEWVCSASSACRGCP